LATLSHELRNPLAAIRPALEVMRRSEDSSNEAARQVIERQLAQIVRLVDDLLDVSRITHGKINLQLERVTLSAAVELALETIRPLAAAARHELTVTLPAEPLYLDADLTRLTQVLLNLLTNSVRYTEPGGKISLTAVRETGQVVVSIKDTGIGIAPESLPYVFDLFSQGVRASQQAQGLGIGLSLVKQLAEMHGGTVSAHSAGINSGSEFLVRLPLAADQRPLPIASALLPAVKKSIACRVLVVDDNADSIEMMKTVLTMDGHEVRYAYDGATAIQVALEYQPELMFLDLGLPDIDGYEVAARLRAQLPHTLIVALSGWGQATDRQRTREAGFDRHLVKPLDFDCLPELLSAARQQRKAAPTEKSETS
jgi:CheY-like chemotaxis protein